MVILFIPCFPNFSFVDFIYWFIHSYFYYFLLSTPLEFNWLFFFKTLDMENQILVFRLYYFLIYEFNAIHFPLSTELTASCNFWYVIFSLPFNSKCFLTSILRPSEHTRFFSSAQFLKHMGFPSYLCVLTSSLIPKD